MRCAENEKPAGAAGGLDFLTQRPLATVAGSAPRSEQEIDDAPKFYRR